MSIKALEWALDARQTGPLAAEVRLVLVALADHADPAGRGAYCSAPTIAARLGCTVRSVRRSITALEDAGVIGLGDQQLVAHIRKDRRPVVWDLALDGRHVLLELDGELGAEPYDRDRHGVHAVTPTSPREAPRGDVRGRHGVTRASPKPKTEPKTPTHLPYVTHRSARASSTTATLSRPMPDERGRGRLRALGLTDSHCPGCGERIHRTHTCRRSALAPVEPVPIPRMPAPFVLPPPEPEQLSLTLDEHDPCTGCGTTEAHRPLIDGTGFCNRCYVAGVRAGTINGAEDEGEP